MHSAGEILADPDYTQEAPERCVVLAKGLPHKPAIPAENVICVNAGGRGRALECRGVMLARDRRNKTVRRLREVISKGMCPDG